MRNFFLTAALLLVSLNAVAQGLGQTSPGLYVPACSLSGCTLMGSLVVGTASGGDTISMIGGAAASNNATILFGGVDSTVGGILATKGAAQLIVRPGVDGNAFGVQNASGSSSALLVNTASGTVRMGSMASLFDGILITPATLGGGQPVDIGANGGDTNISISLTPKGTGKFKPSNIQISTPTITLSGPSANTNDTIFSNVTSVAGTTTGNYFAHDFEVAAYNVASSSFSSAMKVGSSIGGPQMTGGYQNFYSHLNIDTAPANSGSHFYVGSLSEVEASVNLGGISGTAAGHLFSGNDTVTANSGATFLRDAIGRETDLILNTGSSVQFVAGQTVVSIGTSTTGGSQETVGFLVGKASGTASIFDTAFGMGGGQGNDGLSTSGWVMRYIPNIAGEPTPTIAGGVSMVGYTITGNAFESNLFSVTGAGVLNAASFKVAGTTVLATPIGSSNGALTLVGPSAGLSIDASAIEATFVGLGAGGSGMNGGAGGTGMTGAENTGIGWHSMTQMTTGGFNTAVGVNTMGFETTGANNVAVGTDAMRNSVGVSNSVALGPNAARNVSGSFNIGIGINALFGAPAGTSTANSNTAIGINAMSSQVLTSAGSNVAIGNNALGGAAVTSASSNIAIGSGSMGGAALTTAINNTVVGVNAGAAITTGAGNTAIGLEALHAATTAGDNTAVGLQAARNTTGVLNTVIGDKAGSAASSTYANSTMVGANAGLAVTTGNTNTVIGTGVGSTTLATGSGNILIGTGTGTDTIASSTNNEVNIGSAIIGYTAAPSIASGFGTSPSAVSGAGTFAFVFAIGTGGAASSGILTLPSAPTGWACDFTDITTTSASVFVTKQTAGTASSVTVTNYSSSAVATAWTAGDVIKGKCLAY